jgi:hypothetical protein
VPSLCQTQMNSPASTRHESLIFLADMNGKELSLTGEHF